MFENKNIVDKTNSIIKQCFENIALFSNKKDDKLYSMFKHFLSNSECNIDILAKHLNFNILFSKIANNKNKVNKIVNNCIVHTANAFESKYVVYNFFEDSIKSKLCKFNILNIDILIDSVNEHTSLDAEDLQNVLIICLLISLSNLFKELFNVDLISNYDGDDFKDYLENDDVLDSLISFSIFMNDAFEDKLHFLKNKVKDDKLDIDFESLKEEKKNKKMDLLNSIKDPEDKYVILMLGKIFPDKTNDLLFNVATNQHSEEDDGIQETQSTNNELQEDVDFTQHVGNNDEYGEDEN